MARCVWALADGDLTKHLQATSEPSAKQWLFTLFENLSHAQLIKFVVTLWAIWTARRKAIHEAIFQSPHAIFSFVKSFISELKILRVNVPAGVGTRTAPVQTVRSSRGWKAPAVGVAKLQVDGVLARNGRRGPAATVCRDHTGKFLGSSAMVFDNITDPSTLEALACREALALALDLSLDRVVIACDCKPVVEEIENGSDGKYGMIIKEIVTRARDLTSCKFVFEGRAMNVDAHNLAKFSSSLEEGRHMWLGIPHDPFVISVKWTPE